MYIHLYEFLIGHCIKYDINTPKVWLLCIVHTNLTKRKKLFSCTKLSTRNGMVGAKIGYALGLLVHGKVVVEFGRFFFFISVPISVWCWITHHVTYTARSTLVMLVANVQKLRCKKSGFKSYQPLVGPDEMQVSCTAAATKSQGAHACCSIHNYIFITFYQ